MITLRHQIELESIILISIAAGASLFITINNNVFRFNPDSAPVASINSPLSVNPTKAPEQNTFSQISPDGTKKVVMKVTSSDIESKYSFYTQDTSGENNKFIFEKTLTPPNSMNIPFNTFSSDNKYFFIQENAEGVKGVFAFKVSGDSFSETEPYFYVTDLFGSKIKNYNFDEATGWASESLIIINTTRENGTKGPSYWFEVPSKAIIQLSTEF